MTTVAIATLGCKVNQFESEALMDSLEQRGYRLVPFGEGADITIINTCTVTHRADFQSRQMVRRAFRSNPKSLIIVTGCYSQVEPEAIARIEGVKYLLGNREKGQIPDLLPLMQKGELPRIQVADIQKETFFSDIPLPLFPSSHSGLSENSGWMRCPLFLLHRSLCQGPIEEPSSGEGHRTSEGIEGEGI